MRRHLSVRASVGMIAALAATVGVSGCGASSSSSTKTASTVASAASNAAGGKSVRLGVFMASSANSYFAANLHGIQDAAGAAGNVSVTEFGANFDASTQANQLRDALASKRFNAWLVAPVDGGSITPEIRQAVADGISVGCILTPCGPNVASQTIQVPGVVVQTGFGYVENGRELGEMTVQACATLNPCKVFWLIGNPQQPLDIARQDGLYSVIKKDPKIQVVAVQPGGYLSSEGFSATQNVLQAHPDVNVIVSSGDQMIFGAYRAATLAGKAGSVKMIGDGCTFQNVALIRAGKVYGCVVNLPVTEGKVAADDVIKALRDGGQRGIVIDPSKQSPVGVIVTKANAKRFTPEFSS